MRGRPSLAIAVTLLALVVAPARAQELWTNNGTSTLASDITSGATALSVASGHGARFPSPSGTQYFYATLVNGTTIEIVKVTARSSDSFSTIVRGQCGTSASAFVTGSRVENRATKCTFEAVQNNFAEVSIDLGSTGNSAFSATVTGQAWVTTSSLIVCQPFATASDGQTVETYQAAQFQVTTANRVAATGFDVLLFSPNGATGTFRFHCTGAREP